jgi:uncharacterized membrane protein YdbT with pleckstrin-like domain
LSYIKNNLLNGEQVIYTAKIHWIIFVPGVFLVALGTYLFTIETEGGGAAILGLLALLFGLFSLAKALIQRATTELGVTTKRVIAKFGFIRRTTMELNHSKVESFHVEQSILGRIFGFGTLVVNGTGGGKTPVPNIDSPLEFRREAMQTIDASQTR